MDAENLKSLYNNYFSSDKNKWSSTDLKRTLKIAGKTLTWLRGLGYAKAGGKLLDVGCATGYYTEAFRLLGCKVTGLDYSDVSIEKASKNFPECKFIEMNGFEPVLSEQFDVIFCRGFSGMNTHDLDFIAGWINKYMPYLSDGGFFVLAYSSNFSGSEKNGETANLTKQELNRLIGLLDGKYRGMFFYYYFGILSRVKKRLHKLYNKNIKDYYYIFIQK